jgi:hypothetical protein
MRAGTTQLGHSECANIWYQLNYCLDLTTEIEEFPKPSVLPGYQTVGKVRKLVAPECSTPSLELSRTDFQKGYRCMGVGEFRPHL